MLENTFDSLSHLSLIDRTTLRKLEVLNLVRASQLQEVSLDERHRLLISIHSIDTTSNLNLKDLLLALQNPIVLHRLLHSLDRLIKMIIVVVLSI